MSTATARLDYRTLPEIKEIVRQAAKLLGQTESSFAVSTLAERARRVIAEHTITRVSARDWEHINSLLASDAEPSAKLRTAARKYKRRSR